MRNLTEYPTPETDALEDSISESESDYRAFQKMKRKAIDLERRLAACREALDEITGEFEAILKTKNAYTGGINILSRAREALTLTTQKQ